MKSKMKYAGLLAVMLLSGCGTLGQGTSPLDCAGFSPIFISQQDIFTDETARQILIHNETGRKLGCW